MSGRLALAGRTAVVTGAGSGIGRAIAQGLAARGCNLALADINEAGLEETVRLVGNRVRVSRHRLDVADRDAVAALPAEVLAAHSGVAVLVNNAGVSLAGSFAETTAEEYDWLMRINFYGVVGMTRAFLPHLKREAAPAQVANISSLFGLIAPAGQTAYSAAKFAVRGFSIALQNELAAEGSNVGVTVVHPGGVRTAIARSARVAAASVATQSEAQKAEFERKFLRLPAERAGEIIVSAIERRKRRVLVGNDAKLLSLVERLMPVSYNRVLSLLGT